MPHHPNEEARIQRLRTALFDLGLAWGVHYQLVDEGPQWSLEYWRLLSPAQQLQAEQALREIMNG